MDKIKAIWKKILDIDTFLKKYYIYQIFVSIIWVLLFILFFKSFTTDSLYRNYKNDDVQYMQVIRTSDYNLSFEARQTHLNSIRININKNSRLKSSDKMHVKLTDSEGYVIAECDSFLYNMNRNYIPVDFGNVNLKTGERYYLFFTFDEMSSSSLLILDSHFVRGFSEAMEYAQDYDSDNFNDDSNDFENVSDELSFDLTIGYSRVANITYVYSKASPLSLILHLVLYIALLAFSFTKYMNDLFVKKIYWAVYSVISLYILGELLNVEKSRPLNIFFPFSMRHWFCLIVIVAVIISLYYLLHSLTGSNIISGLITIILFAAIAYTNHTKLVMRGDSFMPWDLVSAGIAVKTGSTYYFHITKQFVFSILLIITILFVMRLTYVPWVRFSKDRVIFIVGSLVTFSSIFFATILNTGLLNKLKIYYAVYPPIQSFNENGTYMAFFMHLNNINAGGGVNNSPVATEEMLYRYEGEAYSLNLQDNVNGELPGGVKPNVICIMSEAYTDLQRIRNFETSEEVMPYFNNLMNESIYGDLAVSIFGGGTCNTEFEFLTGYSMRSLLPGASVYTFYVNDNIEALPNIYSENGYRTVALHSFDGDWWDRREKYPLLGFDEFYTRDDFDEDTPYVRRYISDMSTFERITDIYEESNDPLFLFCVTMQNHADFSAHYDNMRYDIHMTDLFKEDGSEFTYTNNYLSLLRESDDALEYLIEYLKNSDEPTIVVFFGDHCPSLEAGFYDSLLQADMGTVGIEESLQIYQTPYFIWANYDLNNGTAINTDYGNRGITSPNFLGQTLLDLSGIESPLSRSVLRVLQSNISAISSVAIYDDNGEVYVDNSLLPDDVNDIVSDYSFVQYGLVYYPTEDESSISE